MQQKKSSDVSKTKVQQAWFFNIATYACKFISVNSQQKQYNNKEINDGKVVKYLWQGHTCTYG